MKTVRFNQRGFSLIELMIVVAIIGILSAIAIPNFQRYQQKARQSEAKTNLAGYYSAQKASYAEYSYYPGNLMAIGFKPEGTLNYNISTKDNTAGQPTLPIPTDTGCISTGAAAGTVNCADQTPGSKVPPWTFTSSADAMAPSVCAPTAAVVAGVATFTACASGDINGSGTADEWSITDQNVLTNVAPAIN